MPRGDDGLEGLEVLEESDGGFFFFLLLGGVCVRGGLMYRKSGDGRLT